MLEKLNQLVKEQAGDAILKNSAIPNEKNEEAVAAASSSVMDAFKQQMASGDINQLVKAFSGGSAESQSVSDQAAAGFTTKLAGMGVNMDSAKALASSIIPGIIAKFVNKTKDSQDSSFNIQDVVKQISGPDGKFQLSDLGNLFGGNQGDGKNKPGDGGGMMDKLKDLF